MDRGALWRFGSRWAAGLKGWASACPGGSKHQIVQVADAKTTIGSVFLPETPVIVYLDPLGVVLTLAVSKHLRNEDLTFECDA